MEVIGHIERLVKGSTDELRGELRVLRDGVEEIKKETKHTNGRVTDLERWKIDHEARMQTMQQMKQRGESYYVAPITTGLVVGAILLLGQYLMG